MFNFRGDDKRTSGFKDSHIKLMSNSNIKLSKSALIKLGHASNSRIHLDYDENTSSYWIASVKEEMENDVVTSPGRALSKTSTISSTGLHHTMGGKGAEWNLTGEPVAYLNSNYFKLEQVSDPNDQPIEKITENTFEEDTETFVNVALPQTEEH